MKNIRGCGYSDECEMANQNHDEILIIKTDQILKIPKAPRLDPIKFTSTEN